ncbi:MAG: hypothetical protein IPK48_15215 [Gammaproteobacteria bacterium]|nr:hypothetical protein [Gammaproteobacteria bacterium]
MIQTFEFFEELGGHRFAAALQVGSAVLGCHTLALHLLDAHPVGAHFAFNLQQPPRLDHLDISHRAVAAEQVAIDFVLVVGSSRRRRRRVSRRRFIAAGGDGFQNPAIADRIS